METELATVREDLVEGINAWVVKAINSPMKNLYNPGPEPVVVFFRQMAPVLYDGPAEEEELLETLMSYKEPCMKDLTDTSFEHMTQAATGATTGDWLIEFFKVCKIILKLLISVSKIVPFVCSRMIVKTAKQSKQGWKLLLAKTGVESMWLELTEAQLEQ
jgi:hypothetical protein